MVGTEPDPKATIEKCSGETRAGTEPDPNVAIMMNHDNITIRLRYDVTILKWNISRCEIRDFPAPLQNGITLSLTYRKRMVMLSRLVHSAKYLFRRHLW